MRIDSGLNGQYYGNRPVPDMRQTEEAAPETAATVRTASNPASSNSLLSSSLASALWAVESGRKNNTTSQSERRSPNEFGLPATFDQVRARYMEYSADY